MLWLITGILVTLVVYLLVVVLVNRNRPPGDRISLVSRPKNLEAKLGQTIKITSWNIGYAGLGRGSDFIMDGGKNWFPPSRQTVKNNLGAICAQLEKFRGQILLLQEVSVKSPLSFWQPVRQKIIMSMPDNMALFRPDISTWGLPWPLKIAHGTMTISPAEPASKKLVKLPVEPDFIGGIIKRNYALLVTRFAIENSSGQWVIINLHLAAFDNKGATRQQQFEAVFAFAQEEYEKGNFIVVGGDWNMALTKTDFLHTTNLKHLFWLVDLPKEKLPSGWKIVCDKSVPSVRTNYKPYVEGENYTAVIDGFIVSPNVGVDAVKTTNTGFENTDHMPVSALFSTKRL
ncbi:hypothetical protein MNBD_ALPHA12-42 [hydrothermal vent metagenome]|uniref:Endonuclease/exonuclease/phosphatase domain-containing protein n=1 Tax=hydrothermal vent metagenome TaxID=652676 RepID=A0A3B0UNE4_9ZZZZ